MREWKDALATRIQARWRGIKGRARATGWGEYLAQLDAAALTVQRFARGRLAGYRVGRMRREAAARRVATVGTTRCCPPRYRHPFSTLVSRV